MYTLTGPNNASSVVVTESIPAPLDIVTSQASQGVCDMLSLPRVCRLGDLAPGQSATVTVVVRPNVLIDAQLVIQNVATVASATFDPNEGNNESAAQTVVRPREADLTIEKVGEPNPVVAGNRLTYTLTIRNFGPAVAPDVVVSDVLPAQTAVVSAQASQGTCEVVPGGTTLSCRLGSMAPGATASVTIVVIPAQAGTLTNVAGASGGILDPDTSNNSATAVTSVEPRLAFCLQDDTDPRVTLELNPQTGEYRFTRGNGTVLTGTGRVRRLGSRITLTHVAPGRRVFAVINTGSNRANASLFTFPNGGLTILQDTDIANSVCQLPTDSSGGGVISSDPSGPALNAAVRSMAVTFDRPIDPSTFTADDVVSFMGPSGGIPI
ncbi:MAG: DUF11 domain-containing protein, partial [bacterium]